MPDPVLIAEGLTRLSADLEGLPLVGTKAFPGAFPPNAAGKDAARYCQVNDLVRPFILGQVEKNGRARFTLSDQGRDWLHEQACPRGVLEHLAAALEGRCQALNALQLQLDHQEDYLKELISFVQKTVDKLQNEKSPDQEKPLRGETEILTELWSWQEKNPLKDMALPDLHRRVFLLLPGLSVGQFQDACRKLRERGRLHLHPWTGPLYDLPEPAHAFLSGHEIAYYASLPAQNEPEQSAWSSWESSALNLTDTTT